MEEKTKFELNGKEVEVLVDKNQTLLWTLRTNFKLTGTKFGCGEGLCGACTVLMDNEPVRSCIIAMTEVAGKKVVTIEGLEKDGQLHPVQKAFIEHDALQCGFCTPGMIMNAVGLLTKNPKPDHQEIIDGMEDNLCRCGAHTRIIRAIETASQEMTGGLKS